MFFRLGKNLRCPIIFLTVWKNLAVNPIWAWHFLVWKSLIIKSMSLINIGPLREPVSFWWVSADSVFQKSDCCKQVVKMVRTCLFIGALLGWHATGPTESLCFDLRYLCLLSLFVFGILAKCHSIFLIFWGFFYFYLLISHIQ